MAKEATAAPVTGNAPTTAKPATPGAAPTSPAPATTTTAAKAKREKKAIHGYIGPDGSAVEELEQATGVSYKDVATGKSIMLNLAEAGGKPGARLTMAAVFGLKTKFTNEASGNRNAADGPKVDDIAAIQSWLDEFKDGQWSVAGEGAAKGPKWNLDVLASVLAELIGKNIGKTLDISKVREKLNDDVKYRRDAMKNPDVILAYNKAAGTSGPTLASLGEGF